MSRRILTPFPDVFRGVVWPREKISGVWQYLVSGVIVSTRQVAVGHSGPTVYLNGHVPMMLDQLAELNHYVSPRVFGDVADVVTSLDKLTPDEKSLFNGKRGL